VLENSDDDGEQSRALSLDYGDEPFEAESEHSHEAVGAVAATLSSSGSDKYGSDAFEDAQEATSPGDTHASAGGDNNSSGEDDYGNEAFEQEHEPSADKGHAAAIPTHDDELGPASNNQQPAEDEKDDDLRHGAEDNSVLEPEKGRVCIPVGTWCSEKIEGLRAASANPKTNQPGPDINRVSGRIPSAAVESLIHRATSSRQRQRPRQCHRSSRPLSRQKLRTVPASVMQRAQTQFCLARLSDDSNTRPRSARPASEAQPNSLQPVVSTFCAVKCESLRGRLATTKVSETSERWAAPEAGGLSLAALEFVQSIAAIQRGIVPAGSGSATEPAGRMLHQVAMATKLQLEDSVALRHQAGTLLERRWSTA
jgi:hypothetical protein